MAAADRACAVGPLVHTICQTWGDMRALKQELKPFEEAALAVQDCVGREGLALHREDPLHTSLQAAATFLLEVKDATNVRRLLEASALRTRAVQLLTAQSQALEAMLPQATDETKAKIQGTCRLIDDAASRCMLHLEVLQSAIMGHVESLQQILSQGTAVPESPAALLGQAQIQRALDAPGMPTGAQQELIQEARLALERTISKGGSATEQLLHEQVLAALTADDAVSPPPVAQPPPQFLCPITLSIMRKPVLASDGQTYEEDALARWLKKSRTSPLSREAMGTDYTQNLALRQLIQAWRAASPSRSVCVCGVGGGWEGCTLCCQVNIAFETPSLHQTTAYLKQSLSRLPDCLSAARLQEHGLDVDDQDITVLPTAAGPLAARSGNGIDDGTAAPEHVADEQPPAIAQASVSLEEEHVEAESVPDQQASAIISCLGDPARSMQDQCEAAWELWRMACQQRLSPLMARAAVPALAMMLADHERPQGREAAAETLERLAHDDDMRQPIMGAVMPTLVNILQEPASSGMKASAAGILHQLAVDRDLRPAIADAGLSALCALLQDASCHNGRIYIIRALGYMACRADLRERVKASLVQALLGLCQNKAHLDFKRAWAAADVLRMLLENVDARTGLADAALAGLCSLLHAEDADSRCTAARAISSLAHHARLCSRIMDASLPGLVKLLQDKTAPASRGAAADVLASLAAESTLCVAVADAALPALVNLLQDNQEGSRSAALTLESMACNVALRPQVCSAVLPGLITLFQTAACPSGMSQAAAILKHLRGLVHNMMGRLDRALWQPLVDAALPALVSLLMVGNATEDRIVAAYMLGCFAHEACLRQQTATAALVHLAALLQDDSTPKGRAQAAAAIRNLTSCPSLAEEIVGAALAGLVGLLQDTNNLEGSTHAAAALRNLLAHDVSPELCQQVSTAALSGLELLLLPPIALGYSTWDFKFTEGRTQAAAAIGNLAVRASGALRQQIVDAVLEGLVHLLLDHDWSPGQTQAAWIFRVIARGSSHALSLQLADAALVGLVALLRDSSYGHSHAGQEQAACAIGELARSGDAGLKRRIYEAAFGSLECLGRSETNHVGSRGAKWVFVIDALMAMVVVKGSRLVWLRGDSMALLICYTCVTIFTERNIRVVCRDDAHRQ